MKAFMIADRKRGSIIKITPITKKDAKRLHVVGSDWMTIEKCPHCEIGPATKVDCMLIGQDKHDVSTIVRYPCGTYCRFVWDDAQHVTLAGEYRHPSCTSKS